MPRGKIGYWIEVEDGYMCNHCQNTLEEISIVPPFTFCPFCGKRKNGIKSHEEDEK